MLELTNRAKESCRGEAHKCENLLLADGCSFDWRNAIDCHASQETNELLKKYTLGVSERIEYFDCFWLAAGPVYVASDRLGQPSRLS